MQTTLAQEIWPLARDSRTAQIGLIVVGTLLLTASAKIQAPFFPVPATMQAYVVLLLGILYGPRLGFATGLLYLLQGAIGLPVFAGGGGPHYLMGPTAGYLLGFVLAMGIVDNGHDRCHHPPADPLRRNGGRDWKLPRELFPSRHLFR